MNKTMHKFKQAGARGINFLRESSERNYKKHARTRAGTSGGSWFDRPRTESRGNGKNHISGYERNVKQGISDRDKKKLGNRADGGGGGLEVEKIVSGGI